MSNNITSPTKARRTRTALGVLAIAGTIASGVAMAPGAFAADNHQQASPAATAPAAAGHDGDQLNAQGQRTKGFIIENHTNKHFHLLSTKGEYGAPAGYENPPPTGTDLAPGSEYRFEMLWQYLPFVTEGFNAWITYAADDGSQLTVQTHDGLMNYGDVAKVTTPAGISYQVGYNYDTSAHTVTLNNA